jgi:hypothetical protein
MLLLSDFVQKGLELTNSSRVRHILMTFWGQLGGFSKFSVDLVRIYAVLSQSALSNGLFSKLR